MKERERVSVMGEGEGERGGKGEGEGVRGGKERRMRERGGEGVRDYEREKGIGGVREMRGE